VRQKYSKNHCKKNLGEGLAGEADLAEIAILQLIWIGL